MGLIFAEGFDSYGSTSDLSRGWGQQVTSPWAWVSNAGRNGGGCAQCVSATGKIMQTLPILSSFATGSIFGLRGWLKVSAVPVSATAIILIGSQNLAGYAAFGVSASGICTFGDQSFPTTRQTGVTNICDNFYHWFEVQGSFLNGGAAICTVDGITQWNAITGWAQTGNIYNTVALQSVNGATVTVDDLHVVDNNSPNTAIVTQGPQQIITVRGASDSSVQFTPNTGSTNYTQINETTSDEDTSYVQDNISGHADEYTFSSLGFTPNSIMGVQLTHRLKNPGSGGINWKPRCHSGGTTNDGTSQAAPQNYANYRTLYDRDPNTSAAWTPTNLASAKFGQVVG